MSSILSYFLLILFHHDSHFLLFAGLYYELSNNSIYQEMCFKEAYQLANFTGKRTYITTVLNGAVGKEGKHSSKGERSDQHSSGLTVSNTGELA